MYSQNDEEKVILQYFKGRKGHLTDIGANDGVTFSNSRALIEQGWTADLVEPSPLALQRLRKLYSVTESANIYPYAVTTEDGPVMLHESDQHHGDNIALLSTLKETEILRWKGTQQFTPVQVEGMTWDSLGLDAGIFVSIDAEGMDYAILRQIALNNVEMVCIDYNGNERQKAKMIAYCSAYQMPLIHTTGENLIFAR